MSPSAMLLATLLLTVAIIILTIVNLYIGKRLMDIYRLTKKEGLKMTQVHQEIDMKLQTLELLEKRTKSNLVNSGIYSFWPSDN